MGTCQREDARMIEYPTLKNIFTVRCNKCGSAEVTVSITEGGERKDIPLLVMNCNDCSNTYADHISSPSKKDGTKERLKELEKTLGVCPFCKLPVHFIERSNPHSDSNYTGYDIGCGTVGCYLEDGADYWFNERSINELVDMWNRRF